MIEHSIINQSVGRPRSVGWHKRALCPCGWHTDAPFGDLFHVHFDCCPNCGRAKDTFRRGNLAGNASWEIVIMKRILVPHPNKRWWQFWKQPRYRWITKP